jgi:outer membrane protein assembly factor BamD
MKEQKKKNAWILSALLMCGLMLIILAGCASSVKIQETQSDTELFEHAKTLYEQGEYKSALEYFLYVKENFLRSNYAGLTRFYAGQCYFDLEKFDEAIVEYRSFLSFFPSDPNAPAAQYKLGASLFELALGPERDQTTIQEALTELQKVAENYPENTEYVQKTEEYLKKVKDRIANYEFLVARFYRKEKRYRASNSRLLFLMKNYPETALYADALHMLALNYLDLDQREEGKDVLVELLEHYPNYEEREKARKKLAALGENYIPQPVEVSDMSTEDSANRPALAQEAPIVDLPKPQGTLPPLETPSVEATSTNVPDGYVVLLRDEQVFINLIHEDGIREGMTLEVLRNARRVGTLRVIEVQEGFSIGQIESIEVNMAIREDDTVRVLGAE